MDFLYDPIAGHALWQWAAFIGFVLFMLALDLGVFNRKSHVIHMKEAIGWSIVWIVLALIFCGGVWYYMGQDRGVEFLTGYFIEKSLSVDNLFVFLVLFRYFAVPAKEQHRVLFWGMIGVLVMRAVFIGIGAAALAEWHWLSWVLGGFLVFTAVKLLMSKDESVDPSKNPTVRIVKKFIPVTSDYRGSKFFVRENGKLWATPLFLVLVVIETTDLIFAVDSVPAALAVTNDTFVVFTSNVFAVLGLRALYFVLSGFMDAFHYLKHGLSAVLGYVGFKMIIQWASGTAWWSETLGQDPVKIPPFLSLGIITFILTLAVAASIGRAKRQARKTTAQHAAESKDAK